MSTYKTVNSRGKEVFTDISLHPGEILEMEIEARGLKRADVAAEIGMKPSHFSELLHGKRHVSAAVALKLEHLFEISAEYWMRVQVYYDLFLERQREKEAA
jgi:HTH-type transcriptional regulator/antitoxin HigA